MGISPKIHYSSNSSSFPNKKDYNKKYDRYSVRIYGRDILKFCNIFQISHSDKFSRLEKLSEKAAKLREEGWENFATVTNIKDGGSEDVWDISVYHDQHVFPIEWCYTGNCTHGDTMVAVADGRGTVSIRELAEKGEDVPVYCRNSQGKIVIRWMRNPRITGYNQPIFLITLDDGSIIRATKNHKFLLKNGEYIEVKNLKAGDSLSLMTRSKGSIKNAPNKTNIDSRDYWCIAGENTSMLAEQHLIDDFSDEKLKKAALQLTQLIGRRFSTRDWKKYAKENNLPHRFSKWRNNHFNGMMGLSKWAAIECGYENIDCDPQMVENLKRKLHEGYDCSIINNKIVYHKTCEQCSSSFDTDFREHAYCSVACSAKAVASNIKITEKIKQSLEKTSSGKNALRLQYIQIYNDVKFSLGRKPMKKEWMEECKSRGVSSEICRKSSLFTTFDELVEVAANYNHRVVSVIPDKFATVYNGTVDEFHNFYVGGFESTTSNGKDKLQFLNNLQCGEQMLAPSGVCCLGTMNLTQFVNKERDGFDLKSIGKYAGYLVRFLDNVNQYSDAPLPAYKESMTKKRRVGCGLMGWGSALFMIKTKFASEKANKLRNEILKTFTHAAIEASIELAKEKGAFELCDPEKHAESPYWNSIDLPKSLLDKMRKYGIRNSSLFSMQPNGNSSILANIVSGGIEPIFMPEYIRTVIVSVTPDHLLNVTPKWEQGEFVETDFFKFTKEGDEQILKGTDKFGVTYKIDKNRGLTKEVLCQDYGVRDLSSRNEWDSTQPWAITTTELTVEEHVSDLQGFAQAVDSACSKCVDLESSMVIIDDQIVYLDELPIPEKDDTFVNFTGKIMNHNKNKVNIKSLYRNGLKSMVDIQFSDGSTLSCTDNHRLWNGNSWIKAQNLSVGDIIG